MKFKIMIMSLFCSLFSFGQMQDLAKLADGKLVLSEILYDSDSNIFGYFYLYERDFNKESKKMEFVLLDKNLNKVNNGEFENKIYKDLDIQYSDCNLMGDKLILSKYYTYRPIFGYVHDILLLSSFQSISLKDNSISNEFKYEDENIVQVQGDLSTLKKEQKKIETKNIVQSFSNKSHNGFFITQYNKNDNDYLEKKFSFFNDSNQLKWKYEYNPIAKNTDYNTFKFQLFKNNNIYITVTRFKNNEASQFKVVNLDFVTGKKKYEYIIDDISIDYVHSIALKEINNHLVINGQYVTKNKSKDFISKKSEGFFNITLDENGVPTQKKYLKWSDLVLKLNIDAKGNNKNKFRIYPRRYFCFKDSTTSILAEMYRPKINGVGLPIPIINLIVYALTYRPQETGNFLLLNFDKNFNLNKVDTIRKEPTKENGTDLLFTQYIKSNDGVAFFYINDFKDKKNGKNNIILGINTYLNGVVTEEKIPLFSKKEYIIKPMPAKEGYIMLREYNEKDKYNQIRLEKLNY